VTTPTATECATLRTRYAAADAALHDLLVGGKTVQVAFNGKMVTYDKSSIGELHRYVQYLRDKVAQCDGGERTARTMVRVIPTN
jgi:hypothetical protein